MSEAGVDCVFCRIAAHAAPATIRYEDADLVAFDGEPQATPLHVLVVPRRHIRSVADLDDIELAGRLVLAATRIAADAGAKSFRLATNSGAPLQDVFHLHWHVMAGGEMGHPAGIAFSRWKRMTQPLVDQLRFTRGEWLRGLEGVTETDASHHHGQMNSIGWIVGHLTWQEQRYLLHRPQGVMLRQDIQDRFAYGAPMSTPALKEMLDAWRTITKAADPFLDALTTHTLLLDLPIDGKPSGQTQGSAIRRLTYHYWFHIGEIQSIRQMLGQKDLPEYVGDIEVEAPYRPE